MKRTSTAQYDFYTGLVTLETDVDNNVSTATEYDALGRAVKVAAAVGTPLEVWTQTVYDDVDRRVIIKSDLETKGDAKKVAIRHYDQLGRIRLSRTLEDAATEDPLDEKDGIKVQTRYMISGGYTYQLVSNPYRANYSSGATNEPEMGWTLSSTHYNGKHSEVETFSGAALPAPWGSNSNTTGKVQTDIDADRTLVTDQAGKQRLSRTNALGQLTDVWEITAADSATEAVSFYTNQQLNLNGYRTSYQYDTLGNLTLVTQGAQTRTFSYSSLSRLLSANNPESGLIQYQYDNNGNLTRKTDARGVVTTYVYDALNRVTNRNYSNEPGGQTPTPNVTYYYDGVYYDASNQQQTATGAVKGKLTSVSSSISRTNYTAFDAVGRVLSSQQITAGKAYDQTYTYNLSGALIEQTYPSGRKVKNVLDSNGDLSIVQSKKNADSGYWNYARHFTYTAAGAVTSMQLGNFRWESTQFNSRLQPVQIALGTTQEATDLLKLDHDYGTTSNNGNVLSQTITVPAVGANTGFTAVQTYTYDSLNRLKSAVENLTPQGGSSVETWKQTFTYDRYGNRNFDEANTTTLPKECTESGNPVVCQAIRPVVNPSIDDSNNRLSTGDGYTFDASGNTTKDAQNRKFTYDAENKQVKVESLDEYGNPISTIGEYFYDGDGKRVKKVVPSTGETTVFIYDASGKLVAEYSTVVTPQQDAKVSYLTTDHLGSPRINTDQNGAVTARHDYQPFGEEITRASYGADTVRKQFTGYERDDETDLDFAQARMYASKLGRFTTVDPALASANRSIPQSWNRYSYTINNPLKFVDPSGMIWGIIGNQPIWYNSLEELEKAGATIYAPPDYQYRDVNGNLVQLDPTSNNWAYVSDIEQADLDLSQAIISGVGMIPGLEFADTFNAGMSFGRGNLDDAALDMAGNFGPLTAIVLTKRISKLRKLAKLGKLGNTDEILAAAKTYLKEKAGFTGEGIPIIVDNSLGVNPEKLAGELRQNGINARSVNEIFGKDPGDANIKQLTEQIGGRVLASDRGRDIGGGFGSSTIKNARQGLSTSTYIRLINEAIK